MIYSIPAKHTVVTRQQLFIKKWHKYRQTPRLCISSVFLLHKKYKIIYNIHVTKI